MLRMSIVSLSVTNLDTSKASHAAPGFVHAPRFSDADAALMARSEAIGVMLLTHAKWRTFTMRHFTARAVSAVA